MQMQRQHGKDKDSNFPAIRDFVLKSRQLQTLYANLEGTYARRILCHLNTKGLTDFLRGSISNHLGDENYKIDINEVAEKLSNKIVSLRTTYSAKHEVHLAIIWVHLFNYSKKQMESTPLIKVFISNEEVQFIDSDAHVYHTWNEFLGSDNLPLALLCVPQDGVYENIKEHLRLNYFNTLLNKREKCSLTMCQSYSEGISLFMDNLLPCIRKFKNNIIYAFHFIWNYLKENLVPMVVLVLKLAYNQFLKTESELSSLANYNTVMNDIMILGNNIVHEVCLPKHSNMSVCAYDSFFQLVIDFFKVLSSYFRETDNISFKDVIKSLLTLLPFARPLIMCVLYMIAPESIMVHNLANFLFLIYEAKQELLKKDIKEEDNLSNNALKLNDSQKLSSLQVEAQSEVIYNFEVFGKNQPLYSANKHPIQLSASQESSIKQVIEALPLLREEMNPKALIDAVRNAAKTLVTHKGPEEYSFLAKSPENHDHIYLFKNLRSIAKIIGKHYQLNSRGKNSYDVLNVYGVKVGSTLEITYNIIIGVFLNNAINHHTTECCCDI